MSKRGLVIRDPYYDAGNHAAQDALGATLADLGVTWVRFEFHVAGGDVEHDLAKYDYFINEVAPRHSLKCLGLLSFGLVDNDPLDLHAPAVPNPHPVYGGGVNPYMAQWLDRARTILQRYNRTAHGVGLDAVEVLNEHNRLPVGDGPMIAPQVAARLHTKLFRMARTVDYVGTKIITGGLHPAGTGRVRSPAWTSDFAYARLVLSSEAFLGYKRMYGNYPLDGFGYHPYPVEIRATGSGKGLRDAQVIIERMTAMRQMINAFGASPFWITELGYNAAYGKQTQQGQADALRQWMPPILARDDVETAFWFKYENFPPADGPNAQKWGLVHIPFKDDPSAAGGARYEDTGTPTLSYAAYKAL